MQFGNRPRAPIVGKPKRQAPLSVGCHAFVNRVPNLRQKVDAVPLTDQSYTRTLQTLADGQEVEILGWRQHPSVRYNVRCVSGGAEGWVAAESLRASRDPLPETSAEGSVPRPSAACVEGPRTRPGPRARSTHVAAVPARKTPTGGESARNNSPLPCPVCGALVHPYNLSRNVSGAIVGCLSCHGRRP